MDSLLNDEKTIKKIIRKTKTKRNLFAVIAKILLIVIIIYVLFAFILGITRVSGLSMYPRMSDSDLVLYYRLDNDIKIGDVVVFERDGNTYILRVIGTENQTIDINKEGNLIIDGHEVEEKVLYKTHKDKTSDIKFPYKVPKGHYFVLGDFRVSSVDSRNFGSIDKEKIKGTVINILRSRDL